MRKTTVIITLLLTTVSAQTATEIGLLLPSERGPDFPVETNSPLDVISPYLHGVPRTKPVARSSTTPRKIRQASLQPNVPSSPPPAPVSSPFRVPDINNLVIPAAAIGLLTIPLIELESTKPIDIWSPTATPMSFDGPFHLFFTTATPTGVAPGNDGGGGSLLSTTTNTVTSVGNTVGSTVGGVTSTASGLVNSTVGTTTGLVSSLIKR